MAITHIEYALVRRLKEEGVLPDNPVILELGQSNWYGDVSLDQLVEDIKRFTPAGDKAEALLGMLESANSAEESARLFKVAEVFWHTFLGPHSYEAVDLHGPDERAYKFDLNEPVPLERQYDIVCNFGTAEHVFNVYQVFKTIHERTKPGGLMVHGLPFQGWVDHGFYTFQPTFYFDLAEINNYVPAVILYAEVTPARIEMIQGRSAIHEMAERGEIGENAMIFVAYVKRSGHKPFKVPMQGYYSRRLDAASAERWKSLR